jgi:hypothetical protein
VRRVEPQGQSELHQPYLELKRGLPYMTASATAARWRSASQPDFVVSLPHRLLTSELESAVVADVQRELLTPARTALAQPAGRAVSRHLHRRSSGSATVLSSRHCVGLVDRAVPLRLLEVNRNSARA